MDKRRVFAALAAVAVVCAMAWIAGFDFNERGAAAFAVAFIAVMYGALAASYPFKDRT